MKKWRESSARTPIIHYFVGRGSSDSSPLCRGLRVGQARPPAAFCPTYMYAFQRITPHRSEWVPDEYPSFEDENARHVSIPHDTYYTNQRWLFCFSIMSWNIMQAFEFLSVVSDAQSALAYSYIISRDLALKFIFMCFVSCKYFKTRRAYLRRVLVAQVWKRLK